MKTLRVILYTLILVSLFFIPLKRVEIANLEPVQAVWMREENGNVVLETDTEDKGAGATVDEALAHMKQNSSGIIYLDTVQYLFADESAQQQISAIRPYVKGSVRVCQWNGQGSIADAVKYVDSHRIGLKIKNWAQGSKLTELPAFEQKK